MQRKYWILWTPILNFDAILHDKLGTYSHTPFHSTSCTRLTWGLSPTEREEMKRGAQCKVRKTFWKAQRYQTQRCVLGLTTSPAQLVAADLKKLEQKLRWITSSAPSQKTWCSKSRFKLILFVWGLARGKTQLWSPNATPSMSQLANRVIWLREPEENNAAGGANYPEAWREASPTEGSSKKGKQ